MKYHTLFLSKTRKDVAKLSSVAVVIGALWLKLSIFIHLIIDIIACDHVCAYKTFLSH